MNVEKNTLYQIMIISAIVLSIISSLIVWQMWIIWPFILFGGLIFLIIIRKKGNIDDERTLKISEKASEKTIIAFIFGTMLLLFSTGPILYLLTDESTGNYRWLLELIGSMFQSAIIISIIYLVFYVYYRHAYGGS